MNEPDKDLFLDLVRTAGAVLNVENKVEAQWALQGFAAGLVDTCDDAFFDDSEYGRYYRSGWAAGMKVAGELS